MIRKALFSIPLVLSAYAQAASNPAALTYDKLVGSWRCGEDNQIAVLNFEAGGKYEYQANSGLYTRMSGTATVKNGALFIDAKTPNGDWNGNQENQVEFTDPEGKSLTMSDQYGSEKCQRIN
ncbi:TPA: hypothetical protein ACP32N_003276 [Pseudomonas aeruginosa]